MALGVKFLTRGNRNVPLGELKMCDMELIEIDTSIPMSEVEFEHLPIYGYESQAPCLNALKRSKYMCRFRLPGDIRWYVGRPNSRRVMRCWRANFPPSISYKEEATEAMVQAVSETIPEMSGMFGTQVGAQLLTCALNSVSIEELELWIEYKKSQEDPL